MIVFLSILVALSLALAFGAFGVLFRYIRKFNQQADKRRDAFRAFEWHTTSAVNFLQANPQILLIPYARLSLLPSNRQAELMCLHDSYKKAIAALNDGFVWPDRKDRIADQENPDYKIVFQNGKPTFADVTDVELIEQHSFFRV